MKTNKKNLLTQRQIIEKKIKPWMALRGNATPPSGWIKAIRGALGLYVRQLAELVGVKHSAITQLEKRETTKKVTLEILERVASAMNCKLMYAVVPDASFKSLEAIVDRRAQAVANDIIRNVSHSMRLEAQGIDRGDTKKQVERLATELKSSVDSRIWGNPRPKKGAK